MSANSRNQSRKATSASSGGSVSQLEGNAILRESNALLTTIETNTKNMNLNV